MPPRTIHPSRPLRVRCNNQLLTTRLGGLEKQALLAPWPFSNAYSMCHSVRHVGFEKRHVEMASRHTTGWLWCEIEGASRNDTLGGNMCPAKFTRNRASRMPLTTGRVPAKAHCQRPSGCAHSFGTCVGSDVLLGSKEPAAQLNAQQTQARFGKHVAPANRAPPPGLVTPRQDIR